MYPRRVRILTAVFIAALPAVAVQLFRLQVVEGEVYRELAREGRVWNELTPTPRGRILDSRGRILACDRPDYGVAVVPSDFPLRGTSVQDLREMRLALGTPEDAPELAREREALRDRLATGEPAVATLAGLAGKDRGPVARGLLSAFERAARYDTARSPEPVLYDVQGDRWQRLVVLLNPPARGGKGGKKSGRTRGRTRGRSHDGSPLPGLRCVFRAKRAYPAGRAACHVTGHVGEYNADEVKALRAQGRLVAAAGRRLRDLRRAAERPEALLALTRVLGREVLERALARGGGGGEAAEVSSLLRRPGVASDLSAVLGPAWEPLADWLGRPDAVELTEGERVWVGSRRHLDDRRIGRVGLERAYNQDLRGRHGYRVMIRNLAIEDGRPVPELDYLREERPRPGSDLVTEIDLSFQLAVEAVLDRTGLPGAAVFIDPGTGAVKALASRPAFDPGVFSSGDSKAIRALLDDPSRPLLNRAIQGLYPPGSVFKVLVAAAALEEGVIRDDAPFECLHVHEIPGRGTSVRRLRCMADPGHGEIDVVRAITVSCNIFFYKTAERLGARALVSWARKLGLGSRTGVDLPAEASGILPRPDEAERATPATTALLGIGQGPIAVTPLQVARAFATIANDGRAHAPRLSKPRAPAARFDGAPQRRAFEAGSLESGGLTGVLMLSARTTEAVVRGMLGVTGEHGGTAWSAFNEPFAPGERSFAGQFPGVRVAGKTATAERGGGEPHAWFAGFASLRDSDEAELAFAVVIEGGGHGGEVAAPAVARMLAAYFRLSTGTATKATRSGMALRSARLCQSQEATIPGQPKRAARRRPGERGRDRLRLAPWISRPANVAVRACQGLAPRSGGLERSR